MDDGGSVLTTILGAGTAAADATASSFRKFLGGGDRDRRGFR